MHTAHMSATTLFITEFRSELPATAAKTRKDNPTTNNGAEFPMAGKHAKPKQGNSFRRNIAVAGTIAMGGLAIPATFAGAAHAEDSPSPVNTETNAASTAPTTTPADYIVKSGDTLSAVASKYGVTLDALKPINPGIIAGDRPDDYSLIFAGGHVHLPVGAKAAKHARKTHVHVWYKNCADAPVGLHRGQAGYRHALDMDRDGKACEAAWPAPDSGNDATDSGAGTATPTAPATNPDGTFVPVIAPDGAGTASGYVDHAPSYWAPLIQQAMGLVGGGVNQGQDVAGVEALMAAESSGDPNAINNYDSNAQSGDPSRGLMQTISATFNAYHVTGTSSNIYDPLANIAAALNYINSVYGGSIPNSPY